ncbi:MAG TPA: hypothetical protein PKX92_07830 [Edaphocola sp.]|nr:hypothetical protein [Edaphocola sp.]
MKAIILKFKIMGTGIRVLTLLFLVGILLFSTKSMAQNEELNNLWKTANTAYNAGQYESAILDYESLLKQRKDAWIYYNLATAYFKQKEEGKAVLNYMRALKLNPELSKAKENIDFILHQNGSKLPLENSLFLIRWYQYLLKALSANGWAVLSLIMLTVTALAFFLRTKKQLKYANRWLAFGISMTVLSFLLAFFAFRENKMENKAVVFQNNTFLFDSEKKGKVLWILPEGTILEISKQKRKGLVFVTLDNGIKGWIDLNEVEMVSG